MADGPQVARDRCSSYMASRSLRRLTCLLVDDNPAMLAAVSAALTQAGITLVGIARTGQEAVVMLQERPAEVVVLDARLPDLHGLEVAELAAEVAPSTAVVIYTSYATARFAARALEGNVRAVVLKSPSPTSLLTALEEIAAGRTYIDPQLRRRSRGA